MADNIERMAVLFEANTKAFENALKKLDGNFARWEKSQVSRLDRLNAGFASMDKRLGGIFSTFKAGLIGGLGLGSVDAVLQSIGAAINRIADIGEIAGRIGLTTDALQVLQRMVIETGGSAEDLNRGMQQFAEQAAEKTSYLAKLFEANGIAIRTAAGELRPMNDLVNEFANLVQNAGSEAEALAIVTKVMGDRAGRELVEAFGKGAQGVADKFEEMKKSSRLHTEAEIKEMEIIRDQYALIMGDIELGWQKMIISMIGWGQELKSDWKSWLPMIGNPMGGLGIMQSIEVSRYNTTLRLQQLEKMKKLPRVPPKLPAVTSDSPFPVDPRLSIPPPKNASNKKTKLPDDDDKKTGGGGGYKPPKFTRPHAPPRVERDEAAEKAKREAEQIARVTQELEFERAQLGRSKLDQEIHNNLRQAGTTLATKQGQEIATLTKAIYAQEQATEKARAAQEKMNAATDYMNDAFANLILEGQDLEETLKGIAKELLRTAITGKGPLAGLLGMSGESGGGLFGGLFENLFGGLFGGFGGFYAGGGTLAAGKWGIVGEKGPEAVFAGPRPMQVYPGMGQQASAPAGPVHIMLHTTPEFGAMVDGKVAQGVRVSVRTSVSEAGKQVDRSFPALMGRHQRRSF